LLAYRTSPALAQTQFGEHRDRIRVIDMALDVFPHSEVVKLRKEGHQADIAIDDFLKPPQFGLAFRRADSHGNGLIAEFLCLRIDIVPVVREALWQLVQV